MLHILLYSDDIVPTRQSKDGSFVLYKSFNNSKVQFHSN